MKKIQETKQKVLENIKKSSGDDDLIIEGFYKRLKSLYNFDSFLGILESLNQDEFNRESASKELNSFFEHINNQKKEQDELQDMAKKITNLTKSYSELDLKQFERFKQDIPFNVFQNYPPWVEEDKNGWSWSTEKKSAKVILSEDKKSVKKTVSSESYTGILGDTEFSDGLWRWEIEMSSGGYLSRWVCFGIIETQYIKNIDSLPYKHYLGLSARGQTYNITKVNEISMYDHKKYLCELDLTRGTFTISCGGEIVCKESGNLKGKKFLPFVVLYTSGNAAKLTVLKSE